MERPLYSWQAFDPDGYQSDKAYQEWHSNKPVTRDYNEAELVRQLSELDKVFKKHIDDINEAHKWTK